MIASNQLDLFGLRVRDVGMRRVWAMPHSDTFKVAPIYQFVAAHLTEGVWLDPFARNTPFRARCVTNDLNPDTPTDFHMESLEFLRRYDDSTVDGVIFDPPYSPRQISECYKSVGRAVHMRDTQSAFYSERKKEVARVLRHGGKALCFGWNSGGIGKSLGFELIDLLLVPHGGWHNDTICTAEVKTS